MSPVELAVEAEARGFYSLYIPEHTHIPTSRRTPAPTGSDELEEEYRRSPDPYIELAGASAVTSKIRLGTGIGLPAQHDPITFAKQLAHARPTLERSSRLRDRLRLEPRRDGESRCRVQDSKGIDSRADVGHASALVQ